MLKEHLCVGDLTEDKRTGNSVSKPSVSPQQRSQETFHLAKVNFSSRKETAEVKEEARAKEGLEVGVVKLMLRP